MPLQNHRALDYHDLGMLLRDKYNVEVIEAEKVQKGIKEEFRVTKPDDIIIALGSLYIVGSIREYF